MEVSSYGVEERETNKDGAPTKGMLLEVIIKGEVKDGTDPRAEVKVGTDPKEEVKVGIDLKWEVKVWIECMEERKEEDLLNTMAQAENGLDLTGRAV